MQYRVGFNPKIPRQRFFCKIALGVDPQLLRAEIEDLTYGIYALGKHAGQSFSETEKLTLGKYDLYVNHLSHDLNKDNDDTQPGDRTSAFASDEGGGEIDRNQVDMNKLSQMINSGALGKK